jgi:uroporphyrinogen-III synthase
MKEDRSALPTAAVAADARSKKVRELLVSQGKQVLEFPLIRPVETPLDGAGRDLIKNLPDFDWVIFTDIFTVDIFFEHLDREDLDYFLLDEMRICALGEAAADRLRFRQVHTDVIPADNSARTVFSAIRDYVYEEKNLSDARILLLRETGRASELADLLKSKTAAVAELEIYESAGFDSPETAKFKALVLGGAIDEFVFSSPEDVYSLFKMIGPDLAGALKEAKVISADEITAQTLQEFGVFTEK